MQGEVELKTEILNSFDNIAGQLADIAGILYSLQVVLEAQAWPGKEHLQNLVPAVVGDSVKKLNQLRQWVGGLAESRRHFERAEPEGRRKPWEEEHHG